MMIYIVSIKLNVVGSLKKVPLAEENKVRKQPTLSIINSCKKLSASTSCDAYKYVKLCSILLVNCIINVNREAILTTHICIRLAWL